MLTVPSSYISPATVQLFRDGGQLPVGYGVAYSERAVEFPWALASLPAGGGKLLDAGSTLNHKELLDLPWVNDWHIHILSAGPEQECHFQKGISYLYEDLRDIPIRDGYYDVVACISTLEHVGMRNDLYYGGKEENNVYDYVEAVEEMYRVLKPGGTFLLTVPYGTYQNGGWFLNYDWGTLRDALIPFRSTGQTPECHIFTATPFGWQRVADSTECYRPHQGRAGSVACVKVIKEG